MPVRSKLGCHFFRVAFAALAVSTSADTGSGWEYSVRTASDGSPELALGSLRNANGDGLWLSCARSPAEFAGPTTVALRATISGSRYLGAGATSLRSTVIRFDDTMPSVNFWVYRERYSQLLDEKSVKGFVRRLAKSDKVAVDLSNYRLEIATVEFDLDREATSKILERLDHDCRRLASSRP